MGVDAPRHDQRSDGTLGGATAPFHLGHWNDGGRNVDHAAPPVDERRRLHAATESTLIHPSIGMSGDTIGPYKLLQKIAEGGMGVVYMAEQLRPVSRRVALKIVKPGMDSREVLARFEAERQALALMDHPNIARVFDAGTTDMGRPYFVMELVKGVKITAYCDEYRLAVKDRLELFLPVCRAVLHAHQKGIIHRDLKPSNILVAQYDGRPVPKVIDFGLAKAIGQRLTEKTMFTQYGQIVGTIDYMSPEQASFNQLDVDTRSDIYSLGVLLYELLTGETPFDRKRLRSAALDELLRIIRQEEPPRPSIRLSSHASLPSIAANRRAEPKKLNLMVRGELDWIVMKAIDKERDRRYQSAGSFAEDIQRSLAGETVLACPPSAGYRFAKITRRYRALLLSVAAVFAALLIGLAGTGWALVLAKRAEARATDELRQKVGHSLRHYQSNLQATYERDRYHAFEEAVCRLVMRLNEQIDGQSPIASPDDTAVEETLSAETIAFWDEVIAASRESSGGAEWRTGYYRLQRALCIARSGDHQTAFEEAAAARHGHGHTADSLRDFIRLYGLCAAAAKDDPRLRERYVDAAIESARRAAEIEVKDPPSIDDSDLKTLASNPEFRAIIAEWHERVNSKHRVSLGGRHSYGRSSSSH